MDKKKEGTLKTRGNDSMEEDLSRDGIKREAYTGNVAEEVIGRFADQGNVRGEVDMLHNVAQTGWVYGGRGESFYPVLK